MQGVLRMGYILPVHGIQYEQYQNRIKGIKINNDRIFRVEKVKRAYLFQVEAREKETIPDNKNTEIRKEKGADRIYAEVTGIGQNFNERI